jgi:hypothetical protein
MQTSISEKSRKKVIDTKIYMVRHICKYSDANQPWLIFAFKMVMSLRNPDVQEQQGVNRCVLKI